MKVVGIELSTAVMRMVLVDGDKNAFAVPFRDEWELTSANRCDDYVQIRIRVVERIKRWEPDVVCIEPLESMALRNANGAMIQTAELRGILAEAARSTGAVIEFPIKAVVNSHLGTHDAKGFARDDTQWSHLGKDFLKKFRPAATIAVSRIRAA